MLVHYTSLTQITMLPQCNGSTSTGLHNAFSNYGGSDINQHGGQMHEARVIVGSTSHTTQALCKSQCSPSVTAQSALGYIMLSATTEVAAAMGIDSRINRIHETQTQHKSCASKGIKAHSRKHQPHYTSHRAQGQPSTSHAHPRASKHIVGSTSHTTQA